jgi:hypothetical protein
MKYKNETFAFEVDMDSASLGAKKIWIGNLHPSKRNINSARAYMNNASTSMLKLFETFKGDSSYPLSWLSTKWSFFIDVLNKFLMESEQYGFTQHFYDLEFFYSGFNKDTSEKQVLTLQMLSAGFFVWLISVIIACIVFAIEHVIAYYKRRNSQ